MEVSSKQRSNLTHNKKANLTKQTDMHNKKLQSHVSSTNATHQETFGTATRMRCASPCDRYGSSQLHLRQATLAQVTWLRIFRKILATASLVSCIRVIPKLVQVRRLLGDILPASSLQHTSSFLGYLKSMPPHC